VKYAIRFAQTIRENNFVLFSGSLILFFLFVLTSIELIKSLQLIIYKYYFQKRQLFSQEKFTQSFPVFLVQRALNLYLWNVVSCLGIGLKLISPAQYHRLFYARNNKPAAESHDQSVSEGDLFLAASHLVYPLDLQRSLNRILRHYSFALNFNYYSAAATPDLSDAASASVPAMVLKNYLFCGSPGCGKSLAVRSLMHRLQRDHSAYLSTIMISGSDLLSLGNLSGNYIKEMINSYLRYSMPLLLVIDESDSIIVNRDMEKNESADLDASGLSREKESENPEETAVSNGNTASPGEEAADSIEKNQQKLIQNTLFSLLEGLRTPSPFLSVVLITRLQLVDIDKAILDRMDSVLPFTLPRKFERLKFLVQQFYDYMLDFLQPAEKEEFLQVYQRYRSVKGKEERELLEDISSCSMSSSMELLDLPADFFDMLIESPGEFRPWDASLSAESVCSTSEFPHFHLLQTLFDEIPCPEMLSEWHQFFTPEVENHYASRLSAGSQLAAPQSTVSSSFSTPKQRRLQSLPLSSRRSNAKVPRSEAKQPPSADPRIELLVSFVQRNCRHFSSDSFQLRMSFKVFLLISSSWSFRDLHKKLMNLRYQILCSERYYCDLLGLF
jgi:hypothetical protein